MSLAGSDEFLQRTAALRLEIDAALARYTQYDSDCPQRLADAIRHSLLAPAKRLRPMLVLMATEACGCNPVSAIPAACAVEMIHTYSLIHDDLPAMDDDDLRRGRPTCHRVFGEALAILAGDALVAQAFHLLSTEIRPAEIALRCCVELSQAAGPSALVGGQADDLASQFSAGTIAGLEAIHRRKTGAMIGVSLRLGGFIGGASEPQMQGLDAFGRKLGLAFQIVDDLLDLKGDETALGKKAHKDSSKGKLTFPSVLGVQESACRAEQLVREARIAMNIFGQYARDLESLAQYVLERNH